MTLASGAALACGGGSPARTRGGEGVSTPTGGSPLMPAGAAGSTPGSVAAPVAGADGSGEGGPGNGIALEPREPRVVPSADELFANVTVAELDRVRTVQEVTWSQSRASDGTRLEFSFEDGEWHASPVRPGRMGDHREVVLGVPEGAELSIKLVAAFGDVRVESPAIEVTNGSAPDRVPRPQIELFDAERASQHRWMLAAVSEGGTGSYGDTHWMLILDRQGRIVWYQASAGGNGSLDSGYAPRISPDGTHLTYDELTRFDDGYVKFATLDFAYEREVRMPGIGDGHAIASDGAVLYEDGERIWEVSPGDASGAARREVFLCDLPAVPQDRGALAPEPDRASCYANALNYDAASDSVVISYPYFDTALQVSRGGEVLRTFGELGDYSIDPAFEFDFNHWAHITPAGTLMVSSHRVGTELHLFNEFAIDDARNELGLIWSFGENAGADYPAERGMAARVAASTNRIVNYGPTGVILEVTEAGDVAWRVKFSGNPLLDRSIQATPLPAGTRGNLVHNNLLLDDLYALNRGPSVGTSP